MIKLDEDYYYNFNKYGKAFRVYSNLNQIHVDSDFQDASRERQEFVSVIFLTLKSCFFLLATISLFRISYASKIRIIRLKEINQSYLYELNKYKDLAVSFDSLFSLKGEQRFMKDQDQMISRDIMRVIWR